MILHVIDNLRPASGGPTTVVIQMAEQQAASGTRVAVVCSHGPDVDSERIALQKRWSEAGIRWFETCHAPLWRRGAVVRSLMRELNPRVVHLHCVWEGILRTAHSQARSLEIPTVMSTHGMLHPFVLAQKRLKKGTYLSVFGRVVRANRCLLALNDEERAYVERRFGTRAMVLPNAIDPGAYEQPSSGAYRATVAGLGCSPFILFVGRLHPIKGIDMLIRAFAEAARAGIPHHLVLAGPDDGSQSSLVALTQALGLAERIHFPGPVWGTMKFCAFAECDVFAHRPRFEGFGIAVAEALASGKPVVTTKSCLLDGAATSGALLEAPDHDSGFAHGLVRACTDEALRDRLREASQAWVRSQLSWQKVLSITNSAYGAR